MTDPKSVTLAKVLSAFHTDRKSGVLDVSYGERTTRVHICDGSIASVHGGVVQLLRAFLVESHTVSAEQWARALRWAEKRQSDVCDALVANGLVTRGILEKLLSLASTEVLLSVLAVSPVTLRSVDESAKANDWHQPLSLPFLLKEAKRRTESWRSLRARIPDDDLVVDKVASFVERALGTTESGGASEDGLTGADRIVYFWANGKKTVEQLAFASCLGRYRAYASLVRLIDLGYVRIAERHGSGEEHKRDSRVLRWSLTGFAYIIAAAVLAAFWFYRPGQLSRPIAQQEMLPEALESQLSLRYRGRVEAALDRHLVLYGRYPKTLAKLLDDAWLEPDDLTEARIGSHEDYRVQGEHEGSYSWRVRKGD